MNHWDRRSWFLKLPKCFVSSCFLVLSESWDKYWLEHVMMQRNLGDIWLCERLLVLFREPLYGNADILMWHWQGATQCDWNKGLFEFESISFACNLWTLMYNLKVFQKFECCSSWRHLYWRIAEYQLESEPWESLFQAINW